MIEEISIANCASYGATPEKLSNLKKINFIYGANGSGKTTISKLIHDQSSFNDCEIKWRNNKKLECLVYNKDFIDRNFNESSQLKGIFTLGKESEELLTKIQEKKSLITKIQSEIYQLNNNLGLTE